MRIFPRPVTSALIIFACLGAGAPVSAEVEAALAAPSTEESRTALTAEAVKNRADDVAAASGLDEATRTLLAELYRQAIGSLEAVKTYREAARRFEAAIPTSKEETARLRAELEQLRGAADAKVPETGELSLADAELQLQEAKAERATIDAQLAEIRSRVQKEKDRPAAVRRLVGDAKNQIAEIESDPIRAAPSESQEVLQARAWVDETKLEQLRAEILMLGQELASQPVRLEALRAQRDLVELQLAAVRARVSALRRG